MTERVHDQPVSLMLSASRDSERLSGSFGIVRCLVVCLCSMVIPGAGQILLGYRRRGLTMMAIVALIVVGVAIAAPRNPFDALALVVQPRVLLSIMVANVGMLVFRIVSVVDAYRLARKSEPDQSHRANLVPVVILTLVLSITAAPHAVVAWYDVATYQAIDRVFNASATTTSTEQPNEVQLTREINLKPGITPAAAPVTDSTSGEPRT